MGLFQDYIIKKYEVFLHNMKKEIGRDKSIIARNTTQKQQAAQDQASKSKQYGQICAKLCREINHFVQVLVKSLILFYNFDISKFKIHFESENTTQYVSCDILNFENLMNFVTILMFPQRLNTLVLKFLSIKNKERNDKFLYNQTNNRQHITMQSLGIIPQFVLNEEEHEQGLTTEEKIKNERKYSYFYEHDDLEDEEEKNPVVKRNSLAHSERGTGAGSSFKKVNIDEILERKASLLQNLKKLSQTKERSASNVKADSYYDAINTLSYLALV